MVETMNFSIENVVKDLRDSFKEKNVKASIEMVDTVVVNKNTKAICIRPEGSNIGVTMNYDRIKAMLDASNGYEDFIERTTKLVINSFENLPVFNADDLEDYSKMKNNLAISVVSLQDNKERLKNIPYDVIGDMAVTYRIVPGEDSSILVTNSLLKVFGITHEQLRKDAEVIAPKKRPLKIATMVETLLGLLPEENKDMLPEDQGMMYVASIPDRTYGAGVIAYPGFIKAVAEKVHHNCYILPSSVHEIILVPAINECNDRIDELKSMVREVNTTEVAPEDKLTDSVYFCDIENNTISVL